MRAVVTAVCRSAVHSMAKTSADAIQLIAGLGVQGDAHAGVTVQHRSRVARDPPQPNLRQVHVLHAELLEELGLRGFAVAPGQMGENVTTHGLDLLGLPTGARLHLGAQAVIEVTGLRNPCRQLEGIQRGLMQAVLARDTGGALVRRAGIMAVVVASGRVEVGDAIRVELPVGAAIPLVPV